MNCDVKYMPLEAESVIYQVSLSNISLLKPMHVPWPLL